MFRVSLITFPLSVISLLSISSDQRTEHICRSSSLGDYLAQPEFGAYSCGECFFYIYGVFPIYRRGYHFERCSSGVLICDLEIMHHRNALIEECHCNNAELIYNIDNYILQNNSSIKSLSKLNLVPSLPSTYLEITKTCCDQAIKCCRNKSNEIVQQNNSECPRTWDGWQCFDSTPNGTVQDGICPPYAYASLAAHDIRHLRYLYVSDEVSSKKVCLPDGNWFTKHINQESQLEYTDYSSCQIDNPYQHFTRMTVSIVSFALSVISIIPALLIFTMYPSLRTEVNQIHINFLISQLLTGIFYIFNTLYFIAIDAPGELLVSANHISCRVLFTFQLRYLRLTNYMWMLCECIFLHRLLNATFSDSHQRLIPFILIGWVFPFVPTVIYSVAREVFDNEECWLNKSRIEWIEWIHLTPGFLSLIINLLLTVGILYIVIRKLRYTPHMEPTQYRKAVRATAMLLPLFGLHFFINIRRMDVYAYQIFSSLMEGLQGLFVVIIICYSNHAVLYNLKQSYQKFRARQQFKHEMVASMHSYRRTTQADIKQTNDDAHYNEEALF